VAPIHERIISSKPAKDQRMVQQDCRRECKTKKSYAVGAWVKCAGEV
jgi:hypothetical protein